MVSRNDILNRKQIEKLSGLISDLKAVLDKSDEDIGKLPAYAGLSKVDSQVRKDVVSLLTTFLGSVETSINNKQTLTKEQFANNLAVALVPTLSSHKEANPDAEKPILLATKIASGTIAPIIEHYVDSLIEEGRGGPGR